MTSGQVSRFEHGRRKRAAETPEQKEENRRKARERYVLKKCKV